MPLGPLKWNAAKPFYDGLTLAANGDPIEKQAAQFGLDKRFPHYETFWKHHVCPATTRPQGTSFRPGVADIVGVVAQRSYSVFVYLLEAVDFLQKVLAGETGPRNRNSYITLMYAGNALQVFCELQCALCGKPKKLMGLNDLATESGKNISLFPDWATAWGPDRDSASTYRNYITHQGWIYSVLRQSTGERMVLARIAFKSGTAHSWVQAEKHYGSNRSNWISLTDAYRGIVDDTISFLNAAYERINKTMAPLLTDPNYQRLWGWKDHQPIELPVAASLPSSGNPTWISTWMTASMASGVDSTPRILQPGSGEKIV
jgi:hypothetical protein